MSLVFATREPASFGLDLAPLLRWGASPRATIALALTSKARAFLDGRGYVTPEDVKSIAMDVLRHRIVPSYEAEAEGLTSVDVIRRVFDTVKVP